MEAVAEGSKVTFTFRPVNAKEFPVIKDYPAQFRYTLKIRVEADEPLGNIKKFEVYTDSASDSRVVRLLWRDKPAVPVKFSAFNGTVVSTETEADGQREGDGASGSQ